MKNLKLLLLSVTVITVSACEESKYNTFQESSSKPWSMPVLNSDAGPTIIPTQHTNCELMPQFTFAKDESFEIVVKCEETTNY